MNLGIIGYANASGIGNLIYGYKEMLPEMSQLVIKYSKKDSVRYYKPHKNDVSVDMNNLSVDRLKEWVKKSKLDLCFMIEYPYNWEYVPALLKLGVKVVMMPLLDAYALKSYKYLNMIKYWIPPTNVASNYLSKQGVGKICKLRVPIDINKFNYIKRTNNKLLLHNAGYGGGNRRKKTHLLYQAFNNLKKVGKLKDVRLIINAQVPLKDISPIKDIEVNIRNTTKPEELYQTGDIFVYPSTADGIGMSILEAMSCGLPAITTNHPPMNEYIKNNSLLIDIKDLKPNMPPNFRPNLDITSLMNVLEYATTHDLGLESINNRTMIENHFSYKVLRPKYLKVFEDILNNK